MPNRSSRWSAWVGRLAPQGVPSSMVRGRVRNDEMPRESGRHQTVLNELGIWVQHWIELHQEDCDPA